MSPSGGGGCVVSGGSGCVTCAPCFANASFCPGGADGGVYPCPAGSWGDAAPQKVFCAGQCQAGYYCPPGSSSATQVPCGSNAVYCPFGAAAPVAVPAGALATGGSATTRTGSGYFSPNTARTPATLFAWVSGASAASTFRFFVMACCTSCSTLAIYDAVMARPKLKSKRRRSSATMLPRCCTSSPSTSRSAQLSRCVPVWCAATCLR